MHTRGVQINIMIDFNKNAHVYHERWKNDDSLFSTSAEHILNALQIKKGDKVLDVCCGTGILTHKIKERVGNEGLVLGLDIAINTLKIASRTDHTVNFINCAAEKFEFNNLFDSITCQYGLSFLSNSHQALKNMRKHLKEDGTIGIVVHGTLITCARIFDEYLNKLIDTICSEKSTISDHKLAIKSKIQSAGMSIKSMEECVLENKYKNFQEYFQRQIFSTPQKLFDKLSDADRVCLKQEVQKATLEFKRSDASLVFPHQVIFVVARIPQAVPASRWPTGQ